MYPIKAKFHQADKGAGAGAGTAPVAVVSNPSASSSNGDKKPTTKGDNKGVQQTAMAAIFAMYN